MRTSLVPTPHGMAISDDERAFFIALGQRIAAQRKARDITQVELAERLGISQQAMNSFEKGAAPRAGLLAAADRADPGDHARCAGRARRHAGGGRAEENRLCGSGYSRSHKSSSHKGRFRLPRVRGCGHTCRPRSGHQDPAQ